MLVLGIWSTLLHCLGGKEWLEGRWGFEKSIKAWLKTTWMSPGVGEELPAGAKGHVKNTPTVFIYSLGITPCSALQSG